MLQFRSMEIHIGNVLRDTAQSVKDGRPNIFSIQFVLNNGEKRSLSKAGRFIKSDQEVIKAMRTNTQPTKGMYYLKDKDLILIRDLSGKENVHPYPVDIHCITMFNNLIVRH